MSLTEAIAVLRKHNTWRRAEDVVGDGVMPAFDHPGATKVCEAIDSLTDQAETLLASLRDLQTVAQRVADPSNEKALPFSLIELAVAQMKAENVIHRALRP